MLPESFPNWGYVVATAVAGLLLVKLLGAFTPSKPEPFLDPKNNARRQRVRLMEKEALSHDVMRFRFELPTPDTPFGLPRGKHIKVFGAYTIRVLVVPLSILSLRLPVCSLLPFIWAPAVFNEFTILCVS